MDTSAAQNRTMKDFLELYNKLVYHCFDKCVSNFNELKTTEEEVKCVDTCADKCIWFNQRHMMVFVEHQNNKQKMAAKAAESQAAVASAAAPVAPQTPTITLPADAPQIPEPPVQPAGVPVPGSSPTPGTLDQGGGDAQNLIPKKVSGIPRIPVVQQLTVLPALKTSTSYAGKSIVDQFLSRSSTDKLKFV